MVCECLLRWSPPGSGSGTGCDFSPGCLCHRSSVTCLLRRRLWECGCAALVARGSRKPALRTAESTLSPEAWWRRNRGDCWGRPWPLHPEAREGGLSRTRARRPRSLCRPAGREFPAGHSDIGDHVPRFPGRLLTDRSCRGRTQTALSLGKPVFGFRSSKSSLLSSLESNGTAQGMP